MGCPFAEVNNACGCLIGYSLPLVTPDVFADITSYPVNVLNVDGILIGLANSPTEYVALWNSDADDQAKGRLRVGKGSFCFFLSKKVDVMPPANVLGSVPITDDTIGFKYGYTDLDTTGAEPLENEYVDSVDTGVILDGGPIVHNANVQVDDFTNPSDKVLFIQVPDTEDPFTKWSEFGNALQQNQPIDPDYATGSNVFFKSIRNGDTIYLTRSQTTITGAVILSR